LTKSRSRKDNWKITAYIFFFYLCRSFFVCLSFFFLSLYCLSVNLWLLIICLVSSNLLYVIKPKITLIQCLGDHQWRNNYKVIKHWKKQRCLCELKLDINNISSILPLYCLSVNLWLLIICLVSSNLLYVIKCWCTYNNNI
jgi:hypothetical protein